MPPTPIIGIFTTSAASSGDSPGGGGGGPAHRGPTRRPRARALRETTGRRGPLPEAAPSPGGGAQRRGGGGPVGTAGGARALRL